MMAPAANLSMGASGFAQRGGATVNRGNGFIRGGGRGYTPQNMQS